jgi:hypothetical protein
VFKYSALTLLCKDRRRVSISSSCCLEGAWLPSCANKPVQNRTTVVMIPAARTTINDSSEKLTGGHTTPNNKQMIPRLQRCTHCRQRKALRVRSCGLSHATSASDLYASQNHESTRASQGNNHAHNVPSSSALRCRSPSTSRSSQRSTLSAVLEPPVMAPDLLMLCPRRVTTFTCNRRAKIPK